MISQTADPLANPIWSALTTEQEALSIGNDLARRYPETVSPLMGIAEPSEAAYQALAQIIAPHERAALFLTEPANHFGQLHLETHRF